MIAATNTAANTQTNTHTAVLCFTSVHTSTGYRLDIGAAPGGLPASYLLRSRRSGAPEHTPPVSTGGTAAALAQTGKNGYFDRAEIPRVAPPSTA